MDGRTDAQLGCACMHEHAHTFTRLITCACVSSWLPCRSVPLCVLRRTHLSHRLAGAPFLCYFPLLVSSRLFAVSSFPPLEKYSEILVVGGAGVCACVMRSVLLWFFFLLFLLLLSPPSLSSVFPPTSMIRSILCIYYSLISCCLHFFSSPPLSLQHHN